MDMDQEVKDREWQLLQFRIDQMFGKYLKDDVHEIDYKPEHAVHLLDMPLANRTEHSETV